MAGATANLIPKVDSTSADRTDSPRWRRRGVSQHACSTDQRRPAAGRVVQATAALGSGGWQARARADRDVADFFGVSETTLNNWKLKHPGLLESLKRGKDEVDALVEQSLFRKATGYTHASEKVFQFQGEIVRTDTVEHYAPDTTAMIFWLKNRQPDKWRDKREGGEGDADSLADALHKLIGELPA